MDFASWKCPFRKKRLIFQGDSHGTKMEFELRSGTRVLAGGFTAAKHLAKFSQADFAIAKFSLSLVRLSSNGHNFFVSAPIHAPFEVLDS